MTREQAVRVVTITQNKVDELCRELIAELQQTADPREPLMDAAEGDASNPTAPAVERYGSDPWSLEGPAMTGDWTETGRSTGQTYKWPDGNVDFYEEVVSYHGTGDFAGMNLSLGFKEDGEIVGFALGSGGGSKRGITYFFTADDFGETDEMVSMIRGGGPKGRSGFAPHEALPTAYSGLRTDVLGNRKRGKWNVQAVVADADDHGTMLNHTALQARLRRLA